MTPTFNLPVDQIAASQDNGGMGNLSRPRVLIIVPAYNESESIAAVLGGLAALSRPHDVLVVSDGSTDATAELARAGGATVLDLSCNMGVGAAMQAGYQFADENGYDIAVQFDGDGQHRADQIETLIAPVASGEAHMSIGSRWLGERDYEFPLDRRLGSRMLAGLVTMLLRRRFGDPTSGFRAASRRTIRFFSRHYPQAWLGDTVEALVELSRHGYRVVEVPAKMLPRQSGQSAAGLLKGVLHTLRIILAVLIDCMEKKFDDETNAGDP